MISDYNRVIFCRRDTSGDLVLEFDAKGKMVGTQKYKDWQGPPMKPGQTVECICTEEAIFIDCPIHGTGYVIDESM